MKKYGKKNANIRITVFWNVTPCSMVDKRQRFVEVCCLHPQGNIIPVRCLSFGNTFSLHCPSGIWLQVVPAKHWYISTKLHGATFQKIIFFILTPAKTLNLNTQLVCYACVGTHSTHCHLHRYTYIRTHIYI
jgi:hypothetical protein